MPSLFAVARWAACSRVITASEIAALRALRHKIVEPPDEDACSSLPEPSPTYEICHDQLERVADAVCP